MCWILSDNVPPDQIIDMVRSQGSGGHDEMRSVASTHVVKDRWGCWGVLVVVVVVVLVLVLVLGSWGISNRVGDDGVLKCRMMGGSWKCGRV